MTTVSISRANRAYRLRRRELEGTNRLQNCDSAFFVLCLMKTISIGEIVSTARMGLKVEAGSMTFQDVNAKKKGGDGVLAPGNEPVRFMQGGKSYCGYLYDTSLDTPKG